MFKLQSIPATRYNRSINVEDGCPPDLSGIIVWVGLDVDTVQFLVKGRGTCPSDDVSSRLEEMVHKGEISIDREYTVGVSVSVSGMVYHTVEAASDDEASDKVCEMINDGEGLEDLWDDYTVDDVNVEEVEEA